jgi:hypothetical protein
MSGFQEIEPDFSPRGEHWIPEEPIIFYIGAEDLGLYNPQITNLSVPIVVLVQPYECQVVSIAVTETNAATSSGNTHISSTTVTTRGVPLHNQPLSV